MKTMIEAILFILKENLNKIIQFTLHTSSANVSRAKRFIHLFVNFGKTWHPHVRLKWRPGNDQPHHSSFSLFRGHKWNMCSPGEY